MARLRSFDPAAAARRARSPAGRVRAGAARVALALAGVLALAGCGVKGPLELPPGAHATPAPAAAAADTSASRSSSSSSTPLIGGSGSSTGWTSGTTNKNTSAAPEQLKGASRPNQPFILDGLL